MVIFELNNLSNATNHNGGAIHFGPDGKLYVAVGENANESNSQTLANLLGRCSRINPNGTIPTTIRSSVLPLAITRRYGLSDCATHLPLPSSQAPLLHGCSINDVGQNTWEEINDGIAGANYGWPQWEGPSTHPTVRSPIFAYTHGSSATTGCAIAGGAFYNPPTQQFPSEYIGDYFFADLCSGWIRRFDPSSAMTGLRRGFPIRWIWSFLPTGLFLSGKRFGQQYRSRL